MKTGGGLGLRGLSYIGHISYILVYKLLASIAINQLVKNDLYSSYSLILGSSPSGPNKSKS